MDAKTISKHEWLRGLPKAELHLHLEGTVTPETVVILSQRHDPTPMTLEVVKALYAYDDFPHFLRTFKIVCDLLRSLDDYALIAKEMIRNLRAQGVRHAEVYVAWGTLMHWKQHLDIGDVMAALEDAKLQAACEGWTPSIFWIADANRAWGADEAAQVFRLAAQLQTRFPTIVGVGIGGNEVIAPIEMFREIYAEAKAAGLRLTAHVGEVSGPEEGPSQIRTALEMGVERIGHGVDAQYDEQVMDLLAARKTVVEINVTSNVLTGACPSPELHPLPQYLERGIFCTLNSDDPAMFHSSCLEEYVKVSDVFSFSLEKMRDLARNSFEGSFLSDEEKKQMILAVDDYL
ncbi:hypothetical protein F5Y16DRAFT_364027 [Xylariaceae sp. FL0255]|nr:hypothetical protein F5Y16DRAFT_364027 [Xylariaceae sp. FL0255]